MKNIIHGVLSDDGILTETGTKFTQNVEKIKTISDICELMKVLNLRQIWIFGDSKVFARLRVNSAELLQENQSFGFAPKELKNSITVWGNGLQKSQIIFAGDLGTAETWVLWELKSPKRLFEAVKWLYEKLDILPSTPQMTGKSLVEKLSNETFEVLNDDAEIFHQNRALDLIFLDKSKAAGKKYIYGFDKNSAYLTAARSYAFGLGDSITQTMGEFNNKFHGLWYVEVQTPNSFDEDKLKLIRLIRNDFPNLKSWLWTSDVQIILDLGAKIKVYQAHIWKYNKRIFEKYCKLLKETREESKVLELKIEEKAIKQIFTKFFGWMNKAPESNYPKTFYRPDWYSAIISTTRANMVRNIMQFSEDSEINILGVHRDEIFIATDLKPEQLPEKLSITYKKSFFVERSEVWEILTGATSASDFTRKVKAYQTEKTIKQFNDRQSIMMRKNEVVNV